MHTIDVRHAHMLAKGDAKKRIGDGSLTMKHGADFDVRWDGDRLIFVVSPGLTKAARRRIDASEHQGCGSTFPPLTDGQAHDGVEGQREARAFVGVVTEQMGVAFTARPTGRLFPPMDRLIAIATMVVMHSRTLSASSSRSLRIATSRGTDESEALRGVIVAGDDGCVPLMVSASR